MVGGDAVGHFLQEHGLAGSRRGYDEHTLSLADRRDQVDDPHVHFFRSSFQNKAIVRVEGGQILKVGAVGDLLRLLQVDRLDTQQGEIALGFLGRPDLAGHNVSVAQPEAAYLRRADVNIIGAGQVVVFGAAEEPEAIR